MVSTTKKELGGNVKLVFTQIYNCMIELHLNLGVHDLVITSKMKL